MKKQVRAMAFGASLLLAGAAFAQDVPPPAQVPPPPPGEATPPPPPSDLPPPPPGNLPPPPTPSDAAPTGMQQAPDPNMPPPATNAPPPPATGEVGSTAASMPTPQGQVTVNSGPAPAKPAGPAPDFKTLSGGKGSITAEQASAYPLLANDFQYADSNRDGRISKAEYQKWVSKATAGGQ